MSEEQLNPTRHPVYTTLFVAMVLTGFLFSMNFLLNSLPKYSTVERDMLTLTVLEFSRDAYTAASLEQDTSNRSTRLDDMQVRLLSRNVTEWDQLVAKVQKDEPVFPRNCISFHGNLTVYEVETWSSCILSQSKRLPWGRLGWS